MGCHLKIESDLIHVFHAILAPDKFLRASTRLLAPTDKIVFGAYTSHASVVEFWWEHHAPSDSTVEDWDRTVKIWKNDEDQPDPMACAIFATPGLLGQLADLVVHLREPYPFFCDHLAAYSEDTALLSFHDAFSAPCYVSADLPKERVDQFASYLGLGYQTVPNHWINNWPEVIDLRNVRFTKELLSCVPAEHARRYRVLPVSRSVGRIRLALAIGYGHDVAVLEATQRLVGADLEVCEAVSTQLDEFIKRLYGSGHESGS